MRVLGLIIAIENYPRSNGEVAARIPGAILAGEKFYRWLVGRKGAAQQDVFICSDGGNFPASIHRYSTERERIVTAIVDLVNAGQNETDELYVFFSGHGFCYQESPEKRSIEILIASDFVSAIESGTKCISLEEVQRKIYAILGGRHHYYFIDACRTIIREGEVEPIPLGRILGRPAVKGMPTRYCLFSTKFGSPADINSQFAPALQDGLEGRGEAKDYIATHELYVTFPRLKRYVQDHVQNQQVDETHEGNGEGYIIRIQPVPTYQCKISVRGGAVGDTFTLKHYPTGSPQYVQNVDFKGSQYIFSYQPGYLTIEVLHEGRVLPRILPPADQRLDFFDDCTAEFQKPPVGQPLRSGVDAPPPPVTNLIAPEGKEINAVRLGSDTPIRVKPGKTNDLQPGMYEFSVRERGSSIGKVTVEIPETGSVDVQLIPELTKAQASIVRAVHGDTARSTIDFSETLGGDFANRDLGLWLTIMGASRILADPELFSKLHKLHLASFADMAPDSSRIYILAGTSQYPRISAAVGGQWQMLERVPGLENVFESTFDAQAGSTLFSAQFEGTEVRTYVSFCLRNRVTLIVFSEDEAGRLTLKQFALPVFHLLNFLNPEVRDRIPHADPLSFVYTMYMFQRYFAQGRALLPPDGQEKTRWMELLYGKWVDPITSLVVCYDILRRGDDELRNMVRTVVVPNLMRYFPDLPDTVAIVASLNPGAAVDIPQYPPLFTDGLLAFAEWEDQLPYAAQKLDYGATFTTWVAAERNPKTKGTDKKHEMEDTATVTA